MEHLKETIIKVDFDRFKKKNVRFINAYLIYYILK